jgi:hypothetical protein
MKGSYIQPLEYPASLMAVTPVFSSPYRMGRKNYSRGGAPKKGRSPSLTPPFLSVILCTCSGHGLIVKQVKRVESHCFPFEDIETDKRLRPVNAGNDGDRTLDKISELPG